MTVRRSGRGCAEAGIARNTRPSVIKIIGKNDIIELDGIIKKLDTLIIGHFTVAKELFVETKELCDVIIETLGAPQSSEISIKSSSVSPFLGTGKGAGGMG